VGGVDDGRRKCRPGKGEGAQTAMEGREIRLYNTLTRSKEPLVPIEPGRVRIYVCGPTVYAPAHLGHARAAVVFDVVRRFLRECGFEVTFVRNYTDVDDKIIQKAQETGTPPLELSRRYAEQYARDMAALGVEKPDHEPRVSEHIKDIIELIKVLVDKGYAYEAGGDVFFSVERYAEYGKLSKRSTEDMIEGARIDVNELKRNPLDFALWKGAKPGEPAWDSPWGKGRPGWHIECSAMSMKYLGESFDIHGGGKDLIFPHHENEIAQSEAATGRPFARYWMHNGMIQINREKMSKSLGNIIVVSEALERWSSEAVRLFFLSHHYRNPADFSEEIMDEAEAALERIYIALERAKTIASPRAEESADTELDEAVKRFLKGWREAMSDDFNTALALGQLFDLLKTMNRSMDARGHTPSLDRALEAVDEFGRVMGIVRLAPEEYLQREKLRRRGAELSEEEIHRLIEERAEARRQKNWARADEIRDYLASKGIVLEDTPRGTLWRVGR